MVLRKAGLQWGVHLRCKNRIKPRKTKDFKINKTLSLVSISRPTSWPGSRLFAELPIVYPCDRLV